jgi:flagellar biosynthesis chaperone FliJ
MAKDIKQKIVLEGEKQYSQALKDANRNLKTLRSELKAETAELGKNATEQQKTEAKVKSLKKQIAEQEKIVATYRSALEEVREKYADNEDAIARWETKLNDARTTLANMKNDLDDVGGGMQNLEADAAATVTATKSVADALGQIGSAGDTVASAIEGIFTGMLDIVKDACSEVWALISETAARADNFGDVAGYWNSDAQEIQRWANAVEGANDSFDDLQNAVSKLVLGDHEKIQKLTGTSWVGDIDQWKYAMSVMNAMSGMDYQQKLETAGELFGEKRASKILDLLNDWDKISLKYNEWNGDESGYGMTSEGLATMQNLYSMIGEINQEWQMLKDRVAEGLGTAAMSLVVNVDGAMDGLAEFLAADSEHERLAALRKIRENLEEFFTKLGEIVRECMKILNQVGEELKNSDDPVTQAIGNILVGLTESLQWMIDHQKEVKAAFEAVFGVWLLAKLAAIAGKLTSIITQIAVIKGFSTLSAAGAAGSAAGSAAGAAAGGSGGGFLGGILGSTAAKVVGGVGAGLAVLFENAIKAQGNDDIYTAEELAEYEKTHPEVGFQRLYGAITRTANGLQSADPLSLFGGALRQIVEDELLDDDTGLVLSPADRQAMENYWDAIREDNGEGTDAANAYLELWNHFNGSAEDLAVFDKITAMIDGLKEFGSLDVDLPSWWFSDGGMNDSGEGEGLTSEDISGFRGVPAKIEAAARKGIAAGISGIKVQMDGVTVGHLVAPTVSQDIAGAIL